MNDDKKFNRSQLQNKLLSDDTSVITQTILNMVFNAQIDDLSWVANQLTSLTHHENEDVKRLATISFGHLALN